MKKTLLMTAAAALLAFPAQAGEKTMLQSQTVTLSGNSGQSMGSVTVSAISGGLMVRAELQDLSPGWHAIHIHGTGDCSDGAEFKKAGGHLKHDAQAHGDMAEKGPHAGDLPNVWAGKDGVGKAEFFTAHAKWADLTGAEGSAFVVHAGPDDYKTDPAGSSGARIACGVIAPKSTAAIGK